MEIVKATNRIYINTTNKCNVCCDFCCMFSGPNKNTFLSYDRFKEIIDNTDGLFELQLEGGEPFLNDEFYWFLNYVKDTRRCVKVVISTNGLILDKHIKRLVEFNKISNIPVLIKISINYYLYNLNNNLFDRCKYLYANLELIDGMDIKFNVRLRKEDDWIVDKLKEYGLFEHSNVYELQNYGRMEDDSYQKPFIVQNIDNWNIYAADGECFGQDLVARSEYEKKLK